MADGLGNAVAEMPEHRVMSPARLGQEHDAAAAVGRRVVRLGDQLVEDAVQLRETARGDDAAQHGPAARLERRAMELEVAARDGHDRLIWHRASAEFLHVAGRVRGGTAATHCNPSARTNCSN
jgi:hypothetical protein